MTFADNILENIERIGKGNTSTGGDITELESYDPGDRVGSDEEHDRDFHAGTNVVTTRHHGEDTRALENRQTTQRLGTKDNAAYTRALSATGISTAQYLVTGTPIQVVGGQSSRRSVRISNVDTTNTVYIGPNTAVTPYTGFPVPPGTVVDFPVSCQMWAVSAASVAVGVIEFLGE